MVCSFTGRLWYQRTSQERTLTGPLNILSTMLSSGAHAVANFRVPLLMGTHSSWDTFRTVHPLLSITSPREWAEIVNTYIDGWRNTGYIPECRSNTKA